MILSPPGAFAAGRIDYGTQIYRPVPLAAPGRPSQYGVPEPAGMIRLDADTLFRFLYRASALRITVKYDFTEVNENETIISKIDETYVANRYEGRFLRNPPSPEARPPTIRETMAIYGGVAEGFVGDPDTVTKTVQVIPNEGDPYEYTQPVTVAILDGSFASFDETEAWKPVPYQRRFYFEQGKYSVPFFAVTPNFPVIFLGQAFRAEEADLAGSIVFNFHGDDLPF